MGVIMQGLEEITKSYAQPVGITTRHLQKQYPMANDSAPADPSAPGAISSDVGGHTAETEEVYLDANLFDEKVRQMVEAAGGRYNFKAAVQRGLFKRVDPELLAAMGRLEKAAPLLNRAVAMARARQSAKGSASGS